MTTGQNLEQPAEEMDVEQNLVEEIREIQKQINFYDNSIANVKKLDKYAHMKMSYILALGDIRRTKANDATAQREAQAANWHRNASIAVTVASIVASSIFIAVPLFDKTNNDIKSLEKQKLQLEIKEIKSNAKVNQQSIVN